MASYPLLCSVKDRVEKQVASQSLFTMLHSWLTKYVSIFSSFWLYLEGTLVAMVEFCCAFMDEYCTSDPLKGTK